MRKTMIISLISLIGLIGLASTETCAQNGSWTIYDTRTSDIGGNNVAAIAPDARGVWVGTYQGLSRLNGGSWMDYSMFNEKLKDQSINCLMMDERGVVWIGTDDYGVIEFDGTHWTEHSAETRRLKMKFVKEIVKDQDGVVWIGVTLGGIVSYDGSMWEKYTPRHCRRPCQPQVDHHQRRCQCVQRPQLDQLHLARQWPA